MYTLAGVQKMSERANEVRGKFWLIGGNFDNKLKIENKWKFPLTGGNFHEHQNK